MPDDDHVKMKVLVDGKEVTPGKKVKLQDHMTKLEMEALIASKTKAQ